MLTRKAAAKIKEMVASAGLEKGWALRLEASRPKNVCSPQHAMRFEMEKPSADDHAFDSGGIRVVVLKRQLEMLDGTEIDFGEKKKVQGFIIDSPNFNVDLLDKWGPVLASDPLSAPK